MRRPAGEAQWREGDGEGGLKSREACRALRSGVTGVPMCSAGADLEAEEAPFE